MATYADYRYPVYKIGLCRVVSKMGRFQYLGVCGRRFGDFDRLGRVAVAGIAESPPPQIAPQKVCSFPCPRVNKVHMDIVASGTGYLAVIIQVKTLGNLHGRLYPDYMRNGIPFSVAIVAEGRDVVHKMEWELVVNMAESALPLLEFMRRVV